MKNKHFLAMVATGIAVIGAIIMAFTPLSTTSTVGEHILFWGTTFLVLGILSLFIMGIVQIVGAPSSKDPKMTYIAGWLNFSIVGSIVGVVLTYILYRKED